jgi:hypothetical protein
VKLWDIELRKTMLEHATIKELPAKDEAEAHDKAMKMVDEYAIRFESDFFEDVEVIEIEHVGDIEDEEPEIIPDVPGQQTMFGVQPDHESRSKEAGSANQEETGGDRDQA